MKIPFPYEEETGLQMYICLVDFTESLSKIGNSAGRR